MTNPPTPSPAPASGARPSCTCATATPTYPVYRSAYHIPPCHLASREQHEAAEGARVLREEEIPAEEAKWRAKGASERTIARLIGTMKATAACLESVASAAPTPESPREAGSLARIMATGLRCPKCDGEKIGAPGEGDVTLDHDGLVLRCDDCGHQFAAPTAEGPRERGTASDVVCQCGHARSCHGTVFQTPSEKTGACLANERCRCLVYRAAAPTTEGPRAEPVGARDIPTAADNLFLIAQKALHRQTPKYLALRAAALAVVEDNRERCALLRMEPSPLMRTLAAALVDKELTDALEDLAAANAEVSDGK